MALPHHLLLILLSILALAVALWWAHFSGLGKCGLTVASDDVTMLRTGLLAAALQLGLHKKVTEQTHLSGTSSPSQLHHKTTSRSHCPVPGLHSKRWLIDTRLCVHELSHMPLCCRVHTALRDRKHGGASYGGRYCGSERLSDLLTITQLTSLTCALHLKSGISHGTGSDFNYVNLLQMETVGGG